MKKILVLCTGNSCRSQMAHGFLTSITNEDYIIYSAGTHPEPVNKYAIEVMFEKGIDISNYSSNHIDEYVNNDIYIALTVCDNAMDRCPIFSKATTFIYKSFKDPAEASGSYDQVINVYRDVRDKLERYINDEFLEIISSNK